MSLLAALTKFFNDYESHLTSLLTAGEDLPVLVGVSGGPDSVALLQALTEFKPAFTSLKLEVAHLNHGLRGNAAAADADYVKQLAQRLQLPCYQAEFQVAALAHAQHLSIETAARVARYAFFAQLLTTHQIRLLLLAHTADDQAETVMLHLLRGSGPHGLTGMTALSPFPVPTIPTAFAFDPLVANQAWVGRPLLPVWRPEIEAYCSEQELAPHLDNTNTETEYRRNRLRLQLLPQIKREYKTDFKKNLVRLASILQGDEQLLDRLTVEAFKRVAVFENGKVNFELAALRAEPPALQARLIRYAYLKLHGSLEDLEALHVELILQAVATTLEWSLDLPGELVARKTTQQLLILPRRGRKFPDQPQMPVGVGSLALDAGSKTRIALANGWWVSTEVRTANEVSNLKQGGPFQAWVDYAKLGERLLIARREPGDKYQPLGASGRRKLQDIMVDVKMPKELRAAWPLVMTTTAEGDGKRIVWLAGYAIANEFKVTPQTNQILEIKLFQEVR